MQSLRSSFEKPGRIEYSGLAGKVFGLLHRAKHVCASLTVRLWHCAVSEAKEEEDVRSAKHEPKGTNRMRMRCAYTEGAKAHKGHKEPHHQPEPGELKAGLCLTTENTYPLK